MRSGIDIDGLSDEVRPQDDLFRHVNGKWLADAVIPSDRAAHGAFHELRDQAEEDVHVILREAAASDAAPGTDERKVGDLFAAFMDVERIEALGSEPVADDLQAIAAVDSVDGLLALMGRLQRHGTPGLVEYYVSNDGDDASRYIVHLVQAGLGLPDESYYRGDEHAELRDQYAEHIATLLDLVGYADPKDAAQRILELETSVAAGHWNRVDSRDALKTYNKLARPALADLAPGFGWSAWLSDQHAPEGAFDEVVASQPSAFTTAGAVLQDAPLDDWKAWLTFHHLRASAPYLSSAFVDANFAFYGRLLSGIPELRERWKRGVAVVEGALGFALGKLYVERHFPPEHKAKMDALVDWLVAAYREDIDRLDWMTAETRERALTKLGKFRSKVGYPDVWRDYSAVEIDRDDLLGSVRRASAFEHDRQLAKLGQPIDRDEWLMTPQTVNAYYHPGMNEIVFPASILRPPFFDPEADDAVNFGGIGAVIGHEIGHGFDDQGSRFDGDGNLVDWWTDEDRANFDVKTKALVDQYDAFEPAALPGHRVNGALTVGENIGDLGGITIAHKAYELSLDGEDAPVLDGYTGPQRVFLRWAELWRTAVRDEEAKRLLTIDPHSPPEFRANVVRNLDEFVDAFGIEDGDGMWVDDDARVRIW